jgi:hypothetical protein
LDARASNPLGSRYLTRRQSPAFASARAKHLSARDSASRWADAESAIVNSASTGHLTSRDEGDSGCDLEK